MFRVSSCNVFLFACVVEIRIHCINGAALTGCTLDTTDASTGIYKCDMNTVTTPMAMSAFSNPKPQRLKMYNHNGTFTNKLSGFTSYNSTTDDGNYATSLEIECSSSGTLTLTTISFADAGYLNVLKITNCAITTIPAIVFSTLDNLDYFLISGGTIEGLHSRTLKGMTVTKRNVPNPRGEFSIVNCQITGGLVSGFLDPLTTVKIITLENVGLTTVSATTFSQNTAVTDISLANNPLTMLPNNLFSGLDGLSSLDLSGINYDCSCDNLWILTYASDNYIDFTGRLVCNTPSTHTDKKATKYYSELCPQKDVCNGTPGLVAGSTCLTVYQLASYFVLLVTLILSCVSLGLVYNIRKQLNDNKNKTKSKKNSSWNRVKDALKRGGGAGQKPPADTSRLKGKGWV